MCRYMLPLPADTITPVQQGIFVTCGLCEIQSHTQRSRPSTTLKAKAKAKDLIHQGQGQGQTSLIADARVLQVGCPSCQPTSNVKALNIHISKKVKSTMLHKRA